MATNTESCRYMMTFTTRFRTTKLHYKLAGRTQAAKPGHPNSPGRRQAHAPTVLLGACCVVSRGGARLRPGLLPPPWSPLLRPGLPAHAPTVLLGACCVVSRGGACLRPGLLRPGLPAHAPTVLLGACCVVSRGGA